MAMIRTGHKPEDWAPIGPARGRVTNSGGVFGGPIVIAGPAVRIDGKPRQEARPTNGLSALVTEGPKRADRGPRCGKLLAIIGEPCARKEGHRNDCRSRLAMDANAVARRSQGTRARTITWRSGDRTP